MVRLDWNTRDQALRLGQVHMIHSSQLQLGMKHDFFSWLCFVQLANLMSGCISARSFAHLGNTTRQLSQLDGIARVRGCMGRTRAQLL